MFCSWEQFERDFWGAFVLACLTALGLGKPTWVHLLHSSPKLNSLNISLEPAVNFSAPKRMLQAHLPSLKLHGLRLHHLYLEEERSPGNQFKSLNRFFPSLSNFCCSTLAPHHSQYFKKHSRGPRSGQLEFRSLCHLFYYFSCLFLCNRYVCGSSLGNLENENILHTFSPAPYGIFKSLFLFVVFGCVSVRVCVGGRRRGRERETLEKRGGKTLIPDIRMCGGYMYSPQKGMREVGNRMHPERMMSVVS